MINEPLKLPCGAILPNRLAKAAMTERLSKDGNANALHAQLYQRWSATGAGLLITGNVMADRDHLESAGNVVVDDLTDIRSLKNWSEAAKLHGNHVWAQISHSGRQTNKFVNRRPKAPSSVQLHKMGLFGRPVAMTEVEIEQVIGSFVNTAVICKKAGFTGIQIHAAHGYLISQFLSPLTNRRDDQWGGSLENRSRILREILVKCRKALGPDFPISVKLNSADFQRGGFDENDALGVITMLNELRIDLLEISGGTYERIAFFDMEGLRESTRQREAYFIDFARKVKQITDIPLMVTGGFRSYAFANEVIENSEVDVAGMARPFILHHDRIDEFINGRVERFDEHTIETSLKSIKDSAEAGFYARNIIRLAQGKETDRTLSPLLSAIHLVVNEMKYLFRKRK